MVDSISLIERDLCICHQPETFCTAATKNSELAEITSSCYCWLRRYWLYWYQ